MANSSARPSARAFRSLVEGLPDVVVRLDRELRMIYASPQAARWIGRTWHEIDLAPGVADRLVAACRHAITSGAVARVDYAHEGRRFHARLVAERGDAAVTGLIEDVTDAHADVEQSLIRIRAENALLEQLVGILGHDLRSPLAAICMTAEALLDSHAAPEGACERIVRSARRMRRMIDELLDVARVRQRGGMPIDPRPCDLHAVVRDTLDELRQAYPAGPIHDRLEGAPDGRWDGDRVAEVVSNLVVNALRHGEPGPIDVVVRGDAASVELEVANPGTIAADDLHAIFDPFRSGRNADGEGLGLGLFISDAIARAHGGSLGVATGAGRTTFTMRLPRYA